MKKSIFIYLVMFSFIFFLSGSAFAAYQNTNFTILMGFDVFGSAEIEFQNQSSDEDTDVGFTPGIEGRFHLQKEISLGLGARYQVPRERDEPDADEFSFLPVYGIFQFNVPTTSEISFGLLVHLGYNFLFCDFDNLEKKIGVSKLEAEGGFYWGVGARITLANNISIEALYNVNYGEITSNQISQDADLTYTKLTLAVGYSF